MSNNNLKNKFKRPKLKTSATTNPDVPRVPQRDRDNEDRSECPDPEQVCPLLAKDSEWVDIVQSPFPNAPEASSSSVGDEEAVLQLVDCEDGPESKPLAIMFPGLLEQDPQTFQGMLTKAMSTTEVTRHLVDLGAKANFQFMKKSNKLIPRDKKWLEKVSESENSNSLSSFESNLFGSSLASDYEADTENAEDNLAISRRKKKKIIAKSKVPASNGAGGNKPNLPDRSPSTGTLTPNRSDISLTSKNKNLMITALVVGDERNIDLESLNNISGTLPNDRKKNTK